MAYVKFGNFFQNGDNPTKRILILVRKSKLINEIQAKTFYFLKCRNKEITKQSFHNFIESGNFLTEKRIIL